MTELPEPLVPPECDCTDLDGFMLNVERLMASELVALSSHEVVAASLFLWCRAWKQRPAASLPDDDRVIAAFAKLPLARFRRLKAEILRGFVLCSDGRLYHRVLAAEAARAYGRKAAFRRKRETDAERLRKWRTTKGETPPGTPDETRFTEAGETQSETRFVAEGQGQGQGQGQRRNKENAAPGGARPDLSDPKTQLYDRAEQVLGRASGGMTTKLIAAKGGSIPQARAAIEAASERSKPREYIGAIIAKSAEPTEFPRMETPV